jgi:hypothetical protein
VRRLNFAARRFRTLLDALLAGLSRLGGVGPERKPFRGAEHPRGVTSHQRTLRQFTEINWSGQTGGDRMLKP